MADDLQELVVRARRRLALRRARLLAPPVGAGLEDRQRCAGLALDGSDAERHPLRRVLEPVGLRVAAGVDLRETLRLDPHPFAVEQPQDARLARLGARGGPG